MIAPAASADRRLSASLAAEDDYLAECAIAVVIPAYNEADHLDGVIRSLPSFVRWAIVVDDCSQDGTADVARRAAERDPRVVLARHETNQGVGGAMISGFRKALELDAQIVVKMDGDGQMDAAFLARLARPLVFGAADYTKGNRFRDFRALARMPALRRAGNMALSFLTKAAVGYWNCFDPCNGYVAIRRDMLAQLPLDKLDRSFFFETSMLARLYLLGAVVRDVPMPARYGQEKSHLRVGRVLWQFPPRLAWCLVRRLALKNFLYDFSMESVYLLAGVPILLFGLLFGACNWIGYALAGQGAPTGTVMLSALAILLGIQILLSAVNEDLRAVPTHRGDEL